MAAGRKPQPQERAFGDEVIGVASAALAVFFILAFYSYHAGGGQPNQMGLVGQVLADLVCPMLGRACYLLPGALLYGTAVLLHLLPFPAPFSQTLSFLLFYLSAATFLALWVEDPHIHVADAGGWIGRFLALHLRAGLSRLGAYVALSPLLLVSFMGVTRFSLRWAGEGVANGLTALLTRCWAALQSLVRFLLALFRRRRSESEPLPLRPRGPRKETASKKAPVQPIPQDDEEEEEKLPPIIISRPAPPVTPIKPVQEKRVAAKPPIESAGNGKLYILPPIPLLDPPVRLAVKVDEDALHASSRILESKLGDFGVEGNVVAVRPGPVITTYEFEPAPGVKVNRVVALADDLQMALRAVSVRILAPIPGKAVVGIEVSNPRREKVCLREILDSPGFQQSESPLTLALGKDTVGNAIVADLGRMPHLLVAGATGTGKSVSLNVMIMSLLYRASPQDVRFIMIDPKMLELSLYEELPHQLSHVITNPKEVGAALQEVVRRMEYRYKLLKDKGVRNIAAYNRALETGQPGRKGVIKLTEVVQEGEEDDISVTHRVTGNEQGFSHQRLPYLVVIVDELADLMLTVGREIEEPITRLAQMGRAAGIHLILATQRPSVDVITGLIKANFPARVSFQVSTKVDSRTILDANGAESLLGRGDMLYLPAGSARVHRLHAPYVTEKEIAAVVEFWKAQGQAQYQEKFLETPKEDREATAGDDSEVSSGGNDNDNDNDPLYNDAVRLVIEFGKASTSLLQRRLRIGYGRAA